MNGANWESAYIYKENNQFSLKVRAGNSTRVFPLNHDQLVVLTNYHEEFQGEAIIKNKIIDRGGEGLVMEVEVENKTYAAKVHIFDLSILSNGKKIEEDYDIVTDICKQKFNKNMKKVK